MTEWFASKSRNFWTVTAPDGREVEGLGLRRRIGEPAYTVPEVIALGQRIYAKRYPNSELGEN